MLKQNIVVEIEKAIKKSWKFPALSNYGGQTLTFSEVAEKIAWLHYIFRKHKIKPGDKIALLDKNSVNWAITYLATITYGAVIVPILPDFQPAEIQHIVNHSDSVCLFVSDSIFEKIDESQMPALQTIFSLKNFHILHSGNKAIDDIIESSYQNLIEDSDSAVTPENFSLKPIDNNQPAAIVYTSGTTGFSKGVVLSHNCLTANVCFAQEELKINAGDTIVSFLPLAHAFGCSFEFLYPFIMGCHITFLRRIPSPKIIVKAFQDIRPTLILSVPLIIEKIYKKHLKPFLNRKTTRLILSVPGINKLIYSKINRKLSDIFGNNFKMIVIGGAALDREVADFLKTINFRYTVGYGLTECGPLVSYAPWDDTRLFSVGRVMSFLKVKIDSDDPQKDVGEILVRGENVMDGYYKDEENTRAAFDEQGWLHTGDLGLLDEDGFIYIKGRSKHMILNASGQNIYPEEIEAKLNNMPFVEESLVIEKNGKLIGKVYPDYDAVDAKGLNEQDLRKKMEDIRKQLNKQLPAYSKLSRIDIFPEEFEKTPTKKIKRRLYQ